MILFFLAVIFSFSVFCHLHLDSRAYGISESLRWIQVLDGVFCLFAILYPFKYHFKSIKPEYEILDDRDFIYTIIRLSRIFGGKTNTYYYKITELLMIFRYILHRIHFLFFR